MNRFNIPAQWQLSSITMFQVNLLTTEVRETAVNDVQRQIQQTGAEKTLSYANIRIEEGLLNIPVCRCDDDCCFVQLFGKLKGEEFQSVAKIGNYGADEFTIINQRIKYVLQNSKQSLKRYYIESDFVSLREHLTAFLFVF